MKITDFYLLEVIGLISLIFILASVIFFILAVISENNTKLFAILGAGTSIISGVLFVFSLIIGIA